MESSPTYGRIFYWDGKIPVLRLFVALFHLMAQVWQVGCFLLLEHIEVDRLWKVVSNSCLLLCLFLETYRMISSFWAVGLLDRHVQSRCVLPCLSCLENVGLKILFFLSCCHFGSK